MRRAWRIIRVFSTGLLIFLAVALLVTDGIWPWYTHRSIPANTHETLYEGIAYIRNVRSAPRPLVIHIVTINLSTPGISFLVTPSQPMGGRQLLARKTSQFLTEFNLQVAVNGDNFTPWHSYTPWNYYPHVNDPVDVYGFASSKGTIYSRGMPGRPTLYISENNQAQFNAPIGRVYNALSGNCFILEQGRTSARFSQDIDPDTPHPRTSIALDSEGRSMIIVVVDGRQPNYSEGVTLAELAEIVAEYGGYTALNLDGGGSATLVARDKSGKPVVLNSPIDNRIPGRERPVANHLGIYAHRP